MGRGCHNKVFPGTAVGCPHCVPGRTASPGKRSSGSRFKQSSARKPYQTTPCRPRRSRPTAHPGPPFGGLDPAYLTEAAPRPEVPAKRARGSPGCCVANESMEAGGGGPRGRGGSLGPAPQRASGRAERGRAEGAGQARAGTWGRGGSALSGGVRELGAERLTVPLRGRTDSGGPGSRTTHHQALRSRSVAGFGGGPQPYSRTRPGRGLASAPPLSPGRCWGTSGLYLAFHPWVSWTSNNLSAVACFSTVAYPPLKHSAP